MNQSTDAGLPRTLARTPLTLALIVVCCVLAIYAPLQQPTSLTFDLMYPDFSYGTRTIVLSRVFASFGFSELLRMITPILLHGGLLHLLFNMVLLWDFGTRIERLQSTLTLAVAIVVIALLSNTIQYLFGGARHFFGGMSGVDYGLFAYICAWQLCEPGKGLFLPVSFIWMTLLLLVVITLLDIPQIGDAAHLGGLGVGALYGAATALTRRVLRTRSMRGTLRD